MNARVFKDIFLKAILLFALLAPITCVSKTGMVSELENSRRTETENSAGNSAQNVENQAQVVSRETQPASSLSPASSLPAQYTVRPWEVSLDCFWNIAAQPWAYNDGSQWRVLYNANKTKLPDPDNPDLLKPGAVLDIPSINKETREGMWEAGRSYATFRR
jgi:hypothetical protein